jgi:hypothetical protein
MLIVIHEGPLDLSTVVAGIRQRLHEMIGANIALQLNLEREGLWVIGTLH